MSENIYQDLEKNKVAEKLNCSIDELDNLCTKLNKQPEEIPDALDKLQIPFDIIKELLPSMTDEMIAIKLTFKPVIGKGVAGILFVIYDSLMKRKADELYWVTTYENLPEDTDASENWEDFRAKMLNLEVKSKDSDYLTQLRTSFNSTAYSLLLKNLFSDDEKIKDDICQKVVSSFYSFATISRKVEYQLEVEYFDHNRLLLSNVLSLRTVNQNSNNETKASISIEKESEYGDKKYSVICNPVVDPVNGTCIRDIKEGDFIAISFHENSKGMVKMVKDSLESKDSPLIFPVIRKRITNTGVIEVVVEIDPSINGNFTMSPHIKIKTIPNTETVVKTLQNIGQITVTLNEKLLWGIAFALTLVLGVIIYLVINMFF